MCYSSEDVSTWLQVVNGAVKMNRQRLLRFGLESILAETLKGTTLESMDDEIPILPPVAYKAVKGLSQVTWSSSFTDPDVVICR